MIKRHSKKLCVVLLLVLTSCGQFKEDKFNEGIAQVNILISEGRITDAQKAADALLTYTLDSYGPSHNNTATALYEVLSLLPETDDKRVNMLKEILEIRKGIYGTDSHQVACVYADLGWCFQQRKNYSVALEYYENARKHIDASQSPERYLASGLAISQILDETLRFDDAQEIRRKTLSTFEQLGLRHYEDMAFLQELVAQVDFNLGNFEEAVEVGNSLLTTKQKAFPENDVTLADTHEFLASCYSYLSQTENALEHFSKALSMKQDVLGDNSPLLLSLLRVRAQFFSSIQKPSQAKEDLLQIKAIFEENRRGVNNHLVEYIVLPALRDLAKRYASEGECEEARKSILASITIAQDTYGEAAPELLQFLDELAYAEQALGKPRAVEAVFSDIESILNNTTDPNDPIRIRYYLRFGDYYRSELLLTEAESNYRKALEIADDLYPADNNTVVTAQDRYAALLDFEQKYAEEESFLKTRLSNAIEKLGSQSSTVLDLHKTLGNFYTNQGNHTQSREHADRYIDGTQRQIKGENALVANSLLEIVSIYIEQGAHEEAKAICSRLLPLYQTVYGLNHWRIGRCMLDIAAIEDNPSRVLELYQRSLEIYEGEFGQEHPILIQVLENYAAVLQRSGKKEKAEELKARAISIKMANGIR